MAVMDVIKDVTNDNINLAECKQGMTAALNALMRNKQLDDLGHIILLMIDHGIMVLNLRQFKITFNHCNIIWFQKTYFMPNLE